ncbi:MAG: hypothetical protein ABFC77_11640 [Thermoguttaceae bacterium]
MMRITCDPCIPLALWAPLALATAALLAWYAASGRRRMAPRRWRLIIAMMTLAATVPLVVLLNPTWLERTPPPAGKPLLTILVDRSASMATSDAERGKTRYEAAVEFAAAAERRLSDRYEVRVRAVAEASAPASIAKLAKDKPGGRATDLATALQDAIENDRPQGQAVLLLSDGIHNVGGVERLRRNAAKAKALAAPVYAKSFGGDAKASDLEVTLEQPQELAFVGQQTPVAVRLRQRAANAVKASLSLSLNDKRVERRDVKLKADGAVEAIFYLSHKTPGLYRYEVRAEPIPGEATTVNNSAPFLLRVVDQPIRVLLLEGKPYWDTKFLVRTLSADPSVELTSLVQIADKRLLQRKIPRQTPVEKTKDDAKKSATPDADRQSWTIEADAQKLLTDPGALAAYQIVVLGRNAEAFLTDDAVAALRKWLAEGEGSLVCFRGPPVSQVGQRLGELMPMRWTPTPESRFHVQLTGAGQTLHWLPTVGDDGNPMAELPSLATSVRPEAAKALAVVLATGAAGDSGASSPVMSYQPVGNGRVVVIEGAGMWRWAFLSPEHQKQEEVYGSLWRSLVRWLVANVGLLPSQKLSLRADKLSFHTDENATATLLVRDGAGDPPQIALSGGDLKRPRRFGCVPRGSSPGQYGVAFGRLGEGRYAIRVEGSDGNDPSGEAAFDVRDNLTERLDLSAQPGVMRMIAETTGGAMLDSSDPKRLARRFDEYLGRTRPERTVHTPAWDRWLSLVGALALWIATWALRRRSGLV